jgi:hypothetical protein
MKRSMRNTLCILFGLILAVSIMLNGCGSKEITAEELLTNTISAMAKVNSYKVDLDMTMDVEVTGGENPMKMTMDANATGAMDVHNQKMQMNMDADVEIPGTGTSKMNMTMSMEMYMVDGWIYTKTTIPGAAEQWTKMESPDAMSQNQAAQLMVLMQSSTASTLKGTEKVNGINCYILEIVPDMATLWQWLMSQQGSNLAGGVDLSQFDLSKVVTDSGLKYWIAQNNYQIIKAETNIAMDMDAETIGVSTDEFDNMTMTMNMGMTFTDYDKAVTIELPAEALNAEEVDLNQY